MSRLKRRSGGICEVITVISSSLGSTDNSFVADEDVVVVGYGGTSENALWCLRILGISKLLKTVVGAIAVAAICII